LLAKTLLKPDEPTEPLLPKATELSKSMAINIIQKLFQKPISLKVTELPEPPVHWVKSEWQRPITDSKIQGFIDRLDSQEI
jgi:hypothetical protein